MKESTLLELDGIGNILLGLPLIIFPIGVTSLLGIPSPESSFYPIILGAVFVGIGIALLVQRYQPSAKGLGLGGALSINLTFGIALIAWLIGSKTLITGSGSILLWLLAIALVGISLFEWGSVSRKSWKN